MPQIDLTVSSGDSLSVRHFAVREAVSDLFEVSVTAVAESPSLDLEPIVGKPASLRAVSGYRHAALRYKAGGGERSWTGVCSFIELVRGVGARHGERPLSTYRLHIVPTLWLLGQRRGNRIFQHLSVPEIADVLLDEWSVERVWQMDRQRYPKLEYRVQYGESDHAVLSRLLEEAGISYTFPDDARGSVLTFSDRLHESPPRDAPPIHHVDSPNLAAEAEYVTNLRLSREVRPGLYTLRDHDFRAPGFELFGRSPIIEPDGRYEHYEYAPGASLAEGGQGGGTPVADDKGVARHDTALLSERALVALQAARTGRATVRFDTNAIDLWPGTVLSVDHHPHADLDRPLLVTELALRGNQVGEEWRVETSAVFADEPYRTPRRTPRPRILGVQSATVVGPPGQEIHTDELGRVRVQLPWDRLGKSDDDSSCWMRVSQGWAGLGFGMVSIPRVGQEVLVGFLDGDPDQPIVVGRVFNAVEQVPYRLPENKTVSGWKTCSSPGGAGYNELKLEDRAGGELIYLQAQRNYHALVKNDAVERTGGTHHATVVDDQHLVVKQTKRQLVERDDHLHVAGNGLRKIDQTLSLTVGVDQQLRVGRNHALDAGEEIHLRAGARLVLEAGDRLTLKGPGGFVDIHAGGVDIVGAIVAINSGGSAGEGLGARPDEPLDAEEAEPRDA